MRGLGRFNHLKAKCGHDTSHDYRISRHCAHVLLPIAYHFGVSQIRCCRHRAGGKRHVKVRRGYISELWWPSENLMQRGFHNHPHGRLARVDGIGRFSALTSKTWARHIPRLQNFKALCSRFAELMIEPGSRANAVREALHGTWQKAGSPEDLPLITSEMLIQNLRPTSRAPLPFERLDLCTVASIRLVRHRVDSKAVKEPFPKNARITRMGCSFNYERLPANLCP